MKERVRNKLEKLRRNPDCGEFIIADAKDADMAWGIPSLGKPWPGERNDPDRWRSMPEFLEQIREIVRQGLVDIMLTSTSVMTKLAFEERLFDETDVTPAIRANDSTDKWEGRGAAYRQSPSLPYASSFIEEAQYGGLGISGQGSPKVNLGLYSITFTNDLEADLASMNAFKAFRKEAELNGFRYILEVFNPNVSPNLPDAEIPAFVNDCLIRALAGVGSRGRPEFLKIPYNGPRWLEELVHYDPSVIVGILGGGSGTTLDAFTMVSEARKYGARAVIYGRKIKDAESPPLLIRFLREVTDNGMPPEEAVRAYHRELEIARIPPKRSLEDDLTITEAVLRA
jgi:hypothetical protein